MTLTKDLRREVVHHFEKVANFRDIGGVKTTNGQTLRTGVLYRSDDLSKMTPQDVLKLKEFNIKVICDLRSPRESQKKQPPFIANGNDAGDSLIKVVNIPFVEQATEDVYFRRSTLFGFMFSKTGGDKYWEFNKWFYNHLVFEQTARIREVITLISNENNLPALIHCGMGKDRTGVLAAMIQMLVGVPYQTALQDYLLSNDYLANLWEKRVKVMRFMTLFLVSTDRMQLMVRTHPDFLQQVHDAIMTKYGSVQNYLTEACQIDLETQQRLKSRLLA